MTNERDQTNDRFGRWLLAAALVALLVLAAAHSFDETTQPAVPVVAVAPSTTTTTTPEPLEQPQAGWTVVASSSRGVMVDTTTITLGSSVYESGGSLVEVPTSTFTVARFRFHSTAFEWHTGYEDPPGAAARLSATNGARIDWATDGLDGVIGAFNGGFKAGSGAGGIEINDHVLEPMVNGDATIAIDDQGHLRIGVWGSTAGLGHGDLVDRQNLSLLVNDSIIAPSALDDDWSAWGSPLHNNPLTARTGIGVDAQGNVLYVATTDGVLPRQLAQALIDAGAVTGMQLDINPFWPILGLTPEPLTSANEPFSISLPGSEHSANVYEEGWERDFFVALAEPGSFACSLSAQIQPPTSASVLGGNSLTVAPFDCSVASG